MAYEENRFLYHNEIESFVQSLQSLPLDTIGTYRWFNQHEYLEKLNVQGLYEAKMQAEETVCEKFVFFDKLYDTVTVASLLETLTFKEAFCENLDDAAMDLTEFCHMCIGEIIARKAEPYFRRRILTATRDEKTENHREQLINQKHDIDVILSAKSVGILCHLVQHSSRLTLSTLTRMCDHHDLPVFLAGLIESSPWTFTEGSKTFKLVDGEWKIFSEDDLVKLTQIEGQLWIAIHQTLLKAEFRTKYCLNESRKNRLMRLRPLMGEVLIDQIPALTDLQRYLDTMSLVDAPMPKKGLIIEQYPIIRERIFHTNKNRWDELASFHVNDICADTSLLKVIAGRMSDIYTVENVDHVLPEPAKCAYCGHPASRKCSNCRSEWYCRRECQVKQWPKHKDICTTLVGINNTINNSD